MLSIVELEIDWDSRSVVKKLAQAVRQCEKLVKLDLNNNLFEDRDIKMILSKLPHLRCLNLGNNGDYCDDGFTGKTCEIIAKCCPQLQSLDLMTHHQLDVPDFCIILGGCPNLRELRTSVTLGRQQLIELVQIAPQLVCLAVGGEWDEDGIFYNESDWAAVVESNGGRTLIRSICCPWVQKDEIAELLSPTSKEV